MCSLLRLLGVISCSIASSACQFAVFLAFLGLASVTVAQPGAGFAGFEKPVFYPTGNVPKNVRAGDLDGDGFLDLVTPNDFTDDISILINNGDGTFQAEIRIPVANVPADVAIADFNGDGVLDIAVAFSSVPPGGNQAIGGVAILIASAPVQYLAPVFYQAGVQPVAIDFGDLDSDGDIDLVTANQISSDIAVLLNNSDGTFAPPVSYSVGNVPQDLRIGDLDNDGDLDVVTAHAFTDDFSVLLNVGDGSFLNEKRFASGAIPSRIALADINLDQRIDILVTSNSSDIAVHLNLGEGMFGESTFFAANGGVLDVEASPVDTGQAPDAVVGRTDSAAGPTPSTGAVLFGDGFGALAPPFDVDVDPASVVAVLAADLDNDGDPEFIVTRFSSIAVAINKTYSPGQADLTGDGAVNSADLAMLIGTWGQSGAGDFDNSGAVDARDLAHLLANWTLTLGVVQPVDNDSQNDGRDARPTERVSVAAAPAPVGDDRAVNDWLAELPLKATLPVVLDIPARDRAMVDLNGDGSLDEVLLVMGPDNAHAMPSPYVLVYVSDGQGGLEMVQRFGMPDFFNPSEIELRKLNDDSAPDLLIADPGGQALVILLGLSEHAPFDIVPAKFSVSPGVTTVQECLDELAALAPDVIQSH